MIQIIKKRKKKQEETAVWNLEKIRLLEFHRIKKNFNIIWKTISYTIRKLCSTEKVRKRDEITNLYDSYLRERIWVEFSLRSVIYYFRYEKWIIPPKKRIWQVEKLSHWHVSDRQIAVNLIFHTSFTSPALAHETYSKIFFKKVVLWKDNVKDDSGNSIFRTRISVSYVTEKISNTILKSTEDIR